MNKLFERFFLKKRNVFCCTNVTLYGNDLFDTVVIRGDELEKYYSFFKKGNISKQKLDERKLSKEVFCILAIDKRNNEPAGFFWGVVPRKESLWHDKFKINKNHAFLFNGYVNPSYRGCGVFPSLISYSVNYIKGLGKIEAIFDIVEVNNIPSNKSHKKINAQIYAINILIKFMGKNLLSIYKQPGGKIMHFYFLTKSKQNSF